MILVTGSTGLVGSHLLCKLIQQGKEVRALYRSKKNKKNVQQLFDFYQLKGYDKIEWIKGDLLDFYQLKDALKEVSIVYHCAAMVSFKPSDRKSMFNANVDGTANLVNAAIDCNIQRFCHVSSIATLGKSQNGELIDETTFWQNDDNHSVYSQSKFRAEMEIWRGTKEGLKAIVVNPSVILGPCPTDKSSGQLIATLSKNMTFYTGGGSGFVDVRDVVDAMIQLANSEQINERFIINGENLKYKELMNVAAKVFEVKAPSIKANRALTGIAWRLERLKYMLFGKEPKMTKETARTSQNQSRYSSDKLMKLMEIQFHSIEEALMNVAEFRK